LGGERVTVEDWVVLTMKVAPVIWQVVAVTVMEDSGVVGATVVVEWELVGSTVVVD
jgi:hypothetical protein